MRWFGAMVGGLLGSTAAMASPGAAAEHVLSHAYDAPAALGACGPFGELADALDRRPDLAVRLREGAGAGAPGQVLDDLLTGEAPGVDRLGAVAVARWEDGSHRVEVPFAGDRDAVPALLRTLSRVVATRGEAWNIVRNGAMVDVVLDHGRLVFADAGDAAAQGRGLTAVPLDGDTLARSCVWLDGQDSLTAATVTPLDAAAPARVRVARMVGGVVNAAAVGAPHGSSHAVPDVVLTVDATWQDAAAALWGGEVPSWAVLGKGVDVGPGATLASFGRQDAEVVLVVPVADRREALSAEKVGRALRGGVASGALASERGVYRAVGGPRELWLAEGDGVLVVGTWQEVVREAARGQGAPWVDAELAELSAGAPIAVSVAGARFAGVAAGAGWELSAASAVRAPDPLAWGALWTALSGGVPAVARVD